MIQEKLSTSELFQLKEGLHLRIKELQQRVIECETLGMTENVEYWKKDLTEAKAIKSMLDRVSNITIQRY